MSVLIDTGLFYALQNRRAARHKSAKRTFSEAIDGQFGTLYTSEYVYDETITLVRARTGSFAEAQTVGERILGRSGFPDVFDLLYVTEEIFDETVDILERYRDHSLSFTDATTVALVDQYNLDGVVSFDDDFDGVVERIDPTTI